MNSEFRVEILEISFELRKLLVKDSFLISDRGVVLFRFNCVFAEVG